MTVSNAQSQIENASRFAKVLETLPTLQIKNSFGLRKKLVRTSVRVLRKSKNKTWVKVFNGWLDPVLLRHVGSPLVQWVDHYANGRPIGRTDPLEWNYKNMIFLWGWVQTRDIREWT